MGAAFSDGTPLHKVDADVDWDDFDQQKKVLRHVDADVDVIWDQRKQALRQQVPLDDDDLDDLVRNWQWVSYTVLTHVNHPKTHLYWIMLAIRFYQGWTVLYG